MEQTLQEINSKLDFLINAISIPKEVFTRNEAAKYLCVSIDILSKEIQKGNIRYKIKGNREYLFKKIWLDEWLEKERR